MGLIIFLQFGNPPLETFPFRRRKLYIELRRFVSTPVIQEGGMFIEPAGSGRTRSPDPPTHTGGSGADARERCLVRQRGVRLQPVQGSAAAGPDEVAPGHPGDSPSKTRHSSCFFFLTPALRPGDAWMAANTFSAARSDVTRRRRAQPTQRNATSLSRASGRKRLAAS